MTIALRLPNRAFGTFPNVPQVFNRDSLLVGFGFLNNMLANHMVGILLKSGFFAREFLEMAFGRLCTALLQALAQGMVALTNLFYLLTTERLTLAVSSQVDDAQINHPESSEEYRELVQERQASLPGRTSQDGRASLPVL